MKRSVAVLSVLALVAGTLLLLTMPVFAENGTQGKSESNPDGGGVDKPYSADGEDAESQHDGSPGDDRFDGNNGCGQDKKEEGREDPSTTESDHVGWDDNNGWCGKPPSSGQSTQAPVRAKSNADDSSVNREAGSEAENARVNNAEMTSVAGEQGSSHPTEVRGVKLQQDTNVLGLGGVRGEALPLTGGSLIPALLLAAQMIVVGLVSGRIGRKRLHK